MNNNLIKVEEKGILNKIKNFFKKIFGKKEIEVQIKQPIQNQEEVETKEGFLDNIKVTEEVKKEADLMSLKEQYDNELISEEKLTKEQITGLIKMYDEQIERLKRKIGQLPQET